MRIALTLTEHEKTSSINNKYLEFVKAAGYTPACFGVGSDVGEIFEMCDGLILKGGSDVEPMYYGDANVSSLNPDPELDEFERQLMWAFARGGKPVFGICRGFQLIFRELCNNEAAFEIPGLAFKQNIKDHNQTHNSVKRQVPFHFIDYMPKLYDWTNNSRAKADQRWSRVNSLHHQGVERTKTFKKDYDKEASPIRILAWDGKVIEAFAAVNYKILAVQWHPEEMMDVALLVGFFDAEEEMNAGG